MSNTQDDQQPSKKVGSHNVSTSAMGYGPAKGHTAPRKQAAPQPKPADPYQKNTENAVINQRQAEILSLRLMAERLKKSQQNPSDMDTILKDVRDNQRIWTFFQTSLYSSNNTVTEPLRSSLLSLCAFIDKRTFTIYATPNDQFDPALLDNLIEINLEIAAGLEGIDQNAKATESNIEDSEQKKQIITETVTSTTA